MKFVIKKNNDKKLTIGEIINVMVNMIDNRDLGLPNSGNFKYDKLAKEHELIKEKLKNTEKELAREKESKRSGSSIFANDEGLEDLSSCK